MANNPYQGCRLDMLRFLELMERMTARKLRMSEQVLEPYARVAQVLYEQELSYDIRTYNVTNSDL